MAPRHAHTMRVLKRMAENMAECLAASGEGEALQDRMRKFNRANLLYSWRSYEEHETLAMAHFGVRTYNKLDHTKH